ncbi:MAG: FlgD immunoglobulin-like domain containing protein [Candidatus Latescibacterota bacterium]
MRACWRGGLATLSAGLLLATPAPAGPWPEPLTLPQAALPLRIEVLAHAPSAPDVVYAAGQEAIWRSDDGGETWTRGGLMLGRAVLAVMLGRSLPSIQVDAADRRLAYVWWGSDGALLRTADGGATWHQETVPGYPVLALVADPVLPDRLYAATSGRYAAQGLGARLLVSADRGASWCDLHCPGAEDATVLLVHPRHAQHLYAGALAGWRVPGRRRDMLWHSPDRGATWEERPLPQRFSLLACDPGMATGLYAAQGHTVWHSADAARTWEARGRIPGGDSGRSQWQVAPHASVPGLLFAVHAGTAPELRFSEDGGWSWRVLPAPLQARAVWGVYPHPARPERLLALGEGGDGAAMALYRRTGRAAAWEEIGMPQVQPPVGTVAFGPDGRVLAGSVRPGEDGRPVPAVFGSQDGGVTWEPLGNLDLALESVLQTIDQLAWDPWRPGWLLGHVHSYLRDMNGLPEGVPGGLLRSTDGGRSLRVWGVGEASSSRHPVIAFDPQAAGVVYLAGPWLGVRRSHDHGSTFVAADGNLPAPVPGTADELFPVLALDPHRPQTLGTVRGRVLWSTADGGARWSPTGRTPEEGHVRLLAFHPLRADRLYALTSEGLFASLDRGTSWQRLVSAPVPLAGVPRLRFDPEDAERLYLVTGPQLLATADGGTSWESLGRDLADTPWCNDVAVDPQRPYRLLAATSWGVYPLAAPAVTAVGPADTPAPRAFALHPNHPNPFHPRTVIPYDLERPGRVRLTVYDVAGQPVRHLFDGEGMAGPSRATWDGTDDRGRPLASGAYLCRLTQSGQAATRRLLLLK